MNPNQSSHTTGRNEQQYSWYNASSKDHFDQVKTSSPNTSIPPTPASSYSNIKEFLSVPVLPSVAERKISILPGESVKHISIEEIQQSEFIAGPSVDKSVNLDDQPQQLSWIELEEEERKDRMGREMNPLIFGKYHQIGLELKGKFGDNGYSFPLWKATRQIEKAAQEFLNENREALESIAFELTSAQKRIQESFNNKFDIDSLVFEFQESDSFPIFERSFSGKDSQTYDWEPVDFDLKKSGVSSEYLELEQLARQERIERGVDPILYGKWHKVGLELLYRYPLGFFNYPSADQILDTAAEATNKIIDATSNIAEKTVEMASDLSSAVADKASEIHLADKIGQVAENLGEIAVGVKDAIIESVQDAHLGEKAVDLKNAIVEQVQDMHIGDRAIDLKDSLVDSAKQMLTTEQIAVAPLSGDFIEHRDLPLNLFAFTSEEVSFIWPRQVPASVYAAEELARSERLSYGVNPIVYGRWNQLSHEFKNSIFFDSSASLAYSYVKPAVIKASEIAQVTKESVFELTSDVTDALGDAFSGSLTGLSNSSLTGGLATGVAHDVSDKMSGFFGSISGMAHSLADSTSHLVDLTKDKLGFSQDPSSIAAEEKERTRRMNNQLVDPMIEARKRRVEEELLKTVKSI